MTEGLGSAMPAYVDTRLRASTMVRVKEILRPLDRAQQARLYKLVSSEDIGCQQTTEAVIAVLLDLLKGKRSAHARRIWTSLFEAVLLRDEFSATMNPPLPGGLHIIDAGAWWLALAPRMVDLVSNVQSRIDMAVRNRPLDQVLISDIGEEAAEELRIRSLAVIRSMRSSQQERTRFISEANKARKQILREKKLPATPRLSVADLDLLESMLECASAWQSLLGVGDRVNESLIVAEAGRIAAVGDLTAAHHLATSVIHRTRDPRYLYQLDVLFPPGMLDAQALVHLDLAATRLQNTIERELRIGLVSRDHRHRNWDCFAAIEEFFAWRDTVVALQGPQSKSTAKVNDIVARVLTLFEGRVVAGCNGLILALNKSTCPSQATELVRVVEKMATMLSHRGIAALRGPWKTESKQLVVSLFREVANDPVTRSLRLVAEYADLADAMKLAIDVSPLDHAVQNLVTTALIRSPQFTDTEMRLIEKTLASAVQERKRSKWWAPPELLALLDAANANPIAAGIVKRLARLE